MLTKHLLNPEQFWGTRARPAIARNDPACNDQDYWRGRIWAPMNYLVYLGLRNYKTPTALQARQALAGRSLALFLSDWSSIKVTCMKTTVLSTMTRMISEAVTVSTPAERCWH